MIEDGKITAPLRNATLIGNGPDVLTRVSMVGNDLQLDEGIGTCGKDGQSVPVGVGIPTLKVDRLTVGGTGSESVLSCQYSVLSDGLHPPMMSPPRNSLIESSSH